MMKPNKVDDKPSNCLPIREYEVLRNRSRIALKNVICYTKPFRPLAKEFNLQKYCAVFVPDNRYTTKKREEIYRWFIEADKEDEERLKLNL